MRGFQLLDPGSNPGRCIFFNNIIFISILNSNYIKETVYKQNNFFKERFIYFIIDSIIMKFASLFISFACVFFSLELNINETYRIEIR